MKRSVTLDVLQAGSEVFDIVIVGGGATGLGAAVDAAARQHRVLLVEQADFGQGTSSRSTKLVHGGVRYLKQGNIALVLEALRERGWLCRNAPHLVHHMSFVIPSYQWWEGPFYGVGMKVYDQLAGSLGLDPSRILSKQDVLEHIPTIEQDHLLGGVIYQDGQFDDARLAVNLAQTAVREGGHVINHMKCVGLRKEQGTVQGVLLRDQLTGSEYKVRAKSVINATGVFADELRRHDEPDAARLIAASQGIHIVLPAAFLPGHSAIMVPKTEDGRVLFCVPWHDRVVVGTTDTPREETELEPRALPEERAFIMEHAARYLAKDPTAEDVCSVFAGLRPLVRTKNAQSTAELSRDHTVTVSPSGLITVAGGKWTTYRKIAEDVINQAEIVAGLENRKSVTQTLSIYGCSEDEIAEPHLRGYGAVAEAIRKMAAESSEYAERVHPEWPMKKAEIVWHVREEMAAKVEDVLARRTRALLLDAKASCAAAETVATIMARELGQGDEWVQAESTAYRQLARRYIFTDSESSASPEHNA